MPTWRGTVLLVRAELGELIVMLDDNGPETWTYRSGPKSVSVIADPFDPGKLEQGARCQVTIEPIA